MSDSLFCSPEAALSLAARVAPRNESRTDVPEIVQTVSLLHPTVRQNASK